MGLHSFYRLALFGASVQALAFPGPLPTDHIDLDAVPLDGWSPRPTAAPQLHQALRRQSTFGTAYFQAPDEICGYLGGSSKSPYGCPDDTKCALVPSSGKVPGAAGCCVGEECNFRLGCVEKADIKECDKSCMADPMTMKCNDGKAVYCNTVSLPLGVTDYYCATKKVKTVQKAQTTYSGQKSRSLSAHTIKPSTTVKSSSTKRTSTTSSSVTTSESSSSTSSETSSTDSSTSTATATDRAAGAETSSPDASASKPSSTNVGAIVGGVLGGIALIALIVLGSIFLRNQKKKNDEMAALAATQHPMKESPFHSQQPSFPSYQPPPPSHFSELAGSTAHAPSQSFSAAPSTHAPSQMYNNMPPSHSAAAMGAAAAAAGVASAAGTVRSQHAPTYHDPSPASTPAASPGPQFSQPHPVPPTYYPYHPSQQNHPNHQPHSSFSHGRDETWMGHAGYNPHQNHNGQNAFAEPIDRHSTSTPLSAYNVAAPVAPVSMLSSVPAEQPGSAPPKSPVPLVLQPAMGRFRSGSGPGSGPGPGSGSGSMSSSGSPPPLGEGRSLTSSPPAVGGGPGVGGAVGGQQNPGQTSGGVVAQPTAQENTQGAVELP